jgi:hypothetical protein
MKGSRILAAGGIAASTLAMLSGWVSTYDTKIGALLLFASGTSMLMANILVVIGCGE